MHAQVHALAAIKSFDALSEVGDRSTNKIPNLLSWVPDFTQELFTKALPRMSGDFTTATRYEMKLELFNEVPEDLGLYGSLFDTITSTCQAYWEDGD